MISSAPRPMTSSALDRSLIYFMSFTLVKKVLRKNSVWTSKQDVQVNYSLSRLFLQFRDLTRGLTNEFQLVTLRRSSGKAVRGSIATSAFILYKTMRPCPTHTPHPCGSRVIFAHV